MMRKSRMNLWLWLSAIATDRAAALAIKQGDTATLVKIRDSLAPWVSR